MKIPKEILELARKGGWMGLEWNGVMETERWAETALDPDFWRGLGKAKGWRMYPLEENPPEWRSVAQHFYDLILTKHPTEQFWEEILGKK